MAKGCSDCCTRTADEMLTGSFWRDLVSETLATALLVSIQCALPLFWSDANRGDAVQTGLGMGFVVIALAWTLGDFGGANMNPAVSLALVLLGKLSIIKGIMYVICQVIGAIAGAFFTYSVTPPDGNRGIKGNLAVTTLSSDLEPWQGFLIEFWITLMLVITVLGSTNDVRKKYVGIAPFPIGLAVSSGIFVAFSSSGASMNPARSFGPAVAVRVMDNDTSVWENHWVYWAGPLSAGFLGSLCYRMFDNIDKPKSD